MLAMADKLMLYKYVVKSVAFNAGYSATFMPKPLFQDNGSGMHGHQSLWSEAGSPSSTRSRATEGLSDIGRWYVGGVLDARAGVLAFAAPTTNSYQRLGARLRGPGQPRLLAAEPLGGVPHPPVLQEPQGEAD